MKKNKKNESKKSHKSVAHLLDLLTYHVEDVIQKPAPCKGACGISADDGTTVFVEWSIEPAGGAFKGEHVWDGVTVNGEACGNRCGGRRKIAQLYAPVIAAQAACDAQAA